MNMASPFRFRSLPALLALAFAFATNAAVAAIYTVGSGSGCTHPTFSSAITSAEINPGADTIRLTRSIAYTQVAATITTAQELDIVGGFATCAQATSDGTTTTLDGAGGSTEPVLRITGNSGAIVRLDTLTIRGGDEDGRGYGGGIYFKGDGILEVRRSTITQNTAGYGGGIYAEGLGTAAELVIGSGVQIIANTARYSGGGVYNEGLEMTMVEPDSWIALNHALGTANPVTGQIEGGYGGGLVILANARAAYTYLGSPGIGNSGPLYFNDARYGGGAAVVANDRNAELRVFTTDPARPTRIRGNSASVAGGALYGNYDDGYDSLRMWYVFIEDNIAPRGAAIWWHASAIGTGPDFNASRIAGSADCPVGRPCGGVIGNVADDATGTSTGGIIETGGFTFPRFSRMTFEQNRGKHLFLGDGSNDGGLGFETHHVAIVDNEVSDTLFMTRDGDEAGIIQLNDTTIAGNLIGANVVMDFNNSYAGASALRRSIIWQPGKTTLHVSGPALELLDMMVSERASVDGGNTPYVVEQDPRFVDPAHGDYSLRAGSPAVDATGTVANDGQDLYSNPRDMDIPVVADFRGIRDIGAIERQTLQPLVLNADFDSTLDLWTPIFAGVTTRDTTFNRTGATGSGSAKVSQVNVAYGQEIRGIVQCVHLPGPGTYALNGWGRGTGNITVPGDIAQLQWQYRRVGGEGCTQGTVTANGALSLSSSASWGRPANPALIEVTAADWTYTSSIAVSLVGIESGVSASPRNTNTWFDGVTLELLASDLIFADDFEP
ncbi:MAG: hypothetical protein J0L88_13015 [Xanthomonadales bacterium]|nr:hypothetical protein [Xanthomonadales bacterium]